MYFREIGAWRAGQGGAVTGRCWRHSNHSLDGHLLNPQHDEADDAVREEGERQGAVDGLVGGKRQCADTFTGSACNGQVVEGVCAVYGDGADRCVGEADVVKSLAIT